eukprot:TRINITY_DN58100_c0_g1_i1.p1 TRINITY_DN58100_c0_g1~~TRINITY_DN58100_c0_g1_i1.p1  ORF type:complete len:895 (-),score=125.08 TRINITY_DN58100_c0_g1_i1:127-2811(-)
MAAFTRKQATLPDLHIGTTASPVAADTRDKPRAKSITPTPTVKKSTQIGAQQRSASAVPFSSPPAALPSPPPLCDHSPTHTNTPTFSAKQLPAEAPSPERESLFRHSKGAKKGLTVAKTNGKPTLLVQMEHYVARELDKLTEALGCIPQPSQERLQIFKECLGMFMNNFTVYAPLLERIMQEYDAFCLFLYRMEDNMIQEQKQQEEEWKFHAQQQLSAAEHRWLAREEELLNQIEAVKTKNKKLKETIEELTEANDKLDSQNREDHERNVLLSGSIVEYRLQHQQDEKQVEKFEELEAELRTLKAQHNEILWALEEARGQIHIETMRAEYTTDRVSELTEENDALKAAMKNLKGLHQNLKAKSSKAAEEISQLTKANDRMSRALAAYERPGGVQNVTPRPLWDDYAEQLWEEHQKKTLFPKFEQDLLIRELDQKEDYFTQTEEEKEEKKQEVEAAAVGNTGEQAKQSRKGKLRNLDTFKKWLRGTKTNDVVEAMWDCVFNLKQRNNDLVNQLSKLERLRDFLEYETSDRVEKEMGTSNVQGCRYFVAHGTGKDVPRFLQYHGKIQNKQFPKGETENFLNNFWKAKQKHDKECAQQNIPAASPQDFLYSFVLLQEGTHHGVVVFCYNLMDACGRYSWDSDCNLFLRIIKGELSQKVFTDQMALLDKLRVAMQRAESSDEGGKKFTTGKLSKRAFNKVLGDFFKTKSKDNLQKLQYAAHTDQPGKSVMYNELFAEDENGTQGAFLELVRYQHLEEILEYVADINEALVQISPDGATVGLADIPAVLMEVDPNKPTADISQMVENGAEGQLEGGGSTTKIDIGTFCKQLNIGFTKRVTPKEAVDGILQARGIEKISAQRGIARRKSIIAPVVPNLGVEREVATPKAKKGKKKKGKSG